MKEEQKKYSPWVHISKKNDTVDDVKVDEKEKSVWSPPTPTPRSTEPEAVHEELGMVPDKREILYWKLHKQYYNASLDILSAEDRELVTNQPDSPKGMAFNRRVKHAIDKDVDYQLNFLN